MAVREALTEAEKYLVSILQDSSGIDIAEFMWKDPDAKNRKGKKDLLFRCWSYQYPWYRNDSKKQIDQCVAEGTLVLTKQGYVPIENVRVDDEVWTHKGRWRKVTFTWDRGEQDVVLVKGFGHHGLVVTADHKFLTQDGSFAALSEGARWGMSTSVTHDGVVPGMRPAYASGRQNWVRDTTTSDFLWLYGLYLAEGSTSSSFGTEGRVNRVTFSVHENEVEYVGSVLTSCGLRYNAQRVGDERCFNLVVNSQPLADWMRESGGVRSSGKRLASWVMALEEKDRQAVLNGYLYGDGWTGTGKQGESCLSFITASKALAYGIKMLAASLGWFGSTSVRQRAAVQIDGRDVTGRESYVTDLRRDRQRAGLPIQDGHAWGLVRSIQPAGKVRVYDLEVEEDHSFVVEGVSVSNCGRAIGKSIGIQMRAFAFPFLNAGQEMLITAPEMIHLDPVTKYIEDRLLSTRISSEMLTKRNNASGITHRPFEAKFVNGAKIIGRIPQKDGKGVKGQHPRMLEMDEAQDYPPAGWVELTETLRYGDETSRWRALGVSRGVRDHYYKLCNSDDWHTHRYCLPGNTLVYAADRPIPIKDIEVGTKVWSVLSEKGDFGLAEVTGKECNGVKATWRVTTKDRSLVTTGNHPYLVLSRSGTRKTRREVELVWINAEDLQPGDVVVTMCAADEGEDLSGPTPEIARLVGALVGDGCRNRNYRPDGGPTRWDLAAPAANPVKRAHFERLIRAAGLVPRPNGVDYWSFVAPELRPWAGEVMQLTSPEREVPAWIWSAPRKTQDAFLEGFLAADGHRMAQVRGQQPWQVDSTSRRLAEQLRALCIYLGRPVGNLIEQFKETNAYTGRSLSWWRFVAYDQERRAQIPSTYSVHALSLHPNLAARTVLSVEPTGEVEETWDLEVAGPHNFVADGMVVSNTAMHRPDWTPAERVAKADFYGSREHPDYRRNILGLHGDQLSALFVLHRLMACVDSNPESDYNLNEYFHVRLNDEFVTDMGMPIESHLDFPRQHQNYRKFWVGMDVGLTNHPSEILVFAEETVTGSRAKGQRELLVRLKCITRVHLERISAPEQIKVMEALVAFYKPAGFGMDRTGLGLPIYQYAIDPGQASQELNRCIRGYNFSEKIPVAFEQPEDPEMAWDDDPMDRAVMGNVLEYSSDTLRLLVDQSRLRLPWDIDMLKEFQGQAYYTAKSSTNPYGKKEFNKGKFHALDAARMAALAYIQAPIEDMLRKEQQDVVPLMWLEGPDDMGYDSSFGDVIGF